MGKIVYRQMLTLGATPTNPHPLAKARMQKGRGKFLEQIPGGAWGMVMDEIQIPALVLRYISLNILSEKTFTVRNCFSPHV